MKKRFSSASSSCRANRVKILVLEHNGRAIGFSAVQIWDNSEEVHEEPYEYVHISDVVVLEGFRGRAMVARY